MYLCFDTYNNWNTTNLASQGQEATDRWVYLSSLEALAVMHVLGVALLRLYLPFMSMASAPQKVKDYQLHVKQSLTTCQALVLDAKSRGVFFGHWPSNLRWPGLDISQDSDLRVYVPAIKNTQAVRIIDAA